MDVSELDGSVNINIDQCGLMTKTGRCGVEADAATDDGLLM